MPVRDMFATLEQSGELLTMSIIANQRPANVHQAFAELLSPDAR